MRNGKFGSSRSASFDVPQDLYDSRPSQARADARRREERERLGNRAVLWAYVVIGIPFLVLVLTGGLTDEFKSGDASAYISGAMVATIAENIFHQAESGFSRLKDLLAILKTKPGNVISDAQRGNNNLWTVYGPAHRHHIARLESILHSRGQAGTWTIA